MLKSAKLLSTLGPVRIDDTMSNRLGEIAALGLGLDADSLYAGIQELIRRGGSTTTWWLGHTSTASDSNELSDAPNGRIGLKIFGRN